jgi:hypothetical protein
MKRAGEGNESQHQQQDVMPTLGQVAVEKRFASLHDLLRLVMDTPVDQLGADLRGGLVQDAGDRARLMQAFFGACDAAARAAEQRKRARSGGGGDEGD